MGKVLVDGLARVHLCGFALAFDRLAKHVHSISTQIVELHLGGFLLVVVVLLVVAQFRDQLIQAMRNSDPRVRIVFVYRVNFFPLHIYFAGRRSNFGVPSIPAFRVR